MSEQPSRPEPAAHGKRVSWVELFFDLVFVFAMTQVSLVVHDDHTWAGIGWAVVSFLLVYWVWAGAAVLGNGLDLDAARNRIGFFAVAGCGMGMALTLTTGHTGRGVGFAACYWLARVVLMVLRQRQRPRSLPNPWTVGAFVVGPMLMVGALVGQPYQFWIWGGAALVDIAMPTLFRRRLASMSVDAEHLSERFGLFVLIALGESIVAVGTPIAADKYASPLQYAATGVAFLLTVGLWWVYFHLAAQAMRFALATADVPFTVVRHVLSYAHFGFIFAIVLMAVGMAEVVAHPGDPLSVVLSGLLVGGCTIFLATFGYTRWMMFTLVSRTRLTAAAVVLLVLPLSWLIPGWLTLAVMAAVLLVLNLFELRKAHLAARVVPTTY